MKGENIGNDPALDEHVGVTLLDLAALALGANRDVAELAKGRGLRTARLQSFLAEIRANYTSTSFSVGHLARKFGLSERYVQDLLHDTGNTFGERVLEARLESARSMLANPRYDALKVIDIAFQSGFGDISNFNHHFRRRFGVTPSQLRDRGAGR